MKYLYACITIAAFLIIGYQACLIDSKTDKIDYAVYERTRWNNWVLRVSIACQSGNDIVYVKRKLGSKFEIMKPSIYLNRKYEPVFSNIDKTKDIYIYFYPYPFEDGFWTVYIFADKDNKVLGYLIKDS